MSQNLTFALEITVIGMSLVFAAIILLWGLMAALVRLTTDQPATEAAEADEAKAGHERALRAQAAAIAVATALARESQRESEVGTFSQRDGGAVSAWQTIKRANQLSRKGPRR